MWEPRIVVTAHFLRDVISLMQARAVPPENYNTGAQSSKGCVIEARGFLLRRCISHTHNPSFTFGKARRRAAAQRIQKKL